MVSKHYGVTMSDGLSEAGAGKRATKLNLQSSPALKTPGVFSPANTGVHSGITQICGWRKTLLL